MLVVYLSKLGLSDVAFALASNEYRWVVFQETTVTVAAAYEASHTIAGHALLVPLSIKSLGTIDASSYTPALVVHHSVCG